MPRVRMTEGPMAGQVIDFVDDKESAQVLDRGYGVPEVEAEAKPKKKSSHAARVRKNRKAEQATEAPLETPEG